MKNSTILLAIGFLLVAVSAIALMFMENGSVRNLTFFSIIVISLLVFYVSSVEEKRENNMEIFNDTARKGGET